MTTTTGKSSLATLAFTSIGLGIVCLSAVAIQAQTSAQATEKQAEAKGGPARRVERTGTQGVSVPDYAQNAPHWLKVPIQVAAAERLARQKHSDNLRNPITADFASEPLAEVINKISVEANLPIWLNQPELELIGVDTETPVSLTLPAKVTARSALRLILKQVGLRAIMRNEIVEITSQESAEQASRMQMYDLNMVLNELGQSNAEDLNSYVQSIVKTHNIKGPNQTATAHFIGARLVLTGSDSLHKQVVELLAQLVVDAH